MATAVAILVVLWGEYFPVYHDFPNTKMCIAALHAIASQRGVSSAFCVDLNGNVIKGD